MTPVSGKVSAATVAAAVASLIVTTIAAHVSVGLPADVLRIAEALLTSAITFGAGWLAKHAPREVIDVASTLVSDIESKPTA